MKIVEDLLDEMGIKYKIVLHEPTFSTEMADKFIEGHIGCRTKTLFLYNNKKTKFIMAILDDKYKLDLNKIKELLGERMKFSSDEVIASKLKSKPGIVTPLCLFNITDNDIEFYFDEEMIENNEILTFHPNINTRTLFIKTQDLFKFIESKGCKIHIAKISES